MKRVATVLAGLAGSPAMAHQTIIDAELVAPYAPLSAAILVISLAAGLAIWRVRSSRDCAL